MGIFFFTLSQTTKMGANACSIFSLLEISRTFAKNCSRNKVYGALKIQIINNLA
jgi:hypothetical protein